MNDRRFYEEQYLGDSYSAGISDRAESEKLEGFINSFRLQNKRVLEVGCGRGAFQGLVNNWIGLDISSSVRRYIRKPFVVGSAQDLPFKDESFDALWSITVLEHIPKPETVLEEISRILRPGGVAYLAPAWHCRSWAANGYHIRSWSDLNWKEKIIKASIPARDALWFRAACTLPVRVWREWLYFKNKARHTPFRYRELTPNYDTYWCSDADACNAMDPHEMLLWFRSRGWTSSSHPTWESQMSIRHGGIVICKPGQAHRTAIQR